MKISLNTIRSLNAEYQSAGDPAPEGVDALVAKIGAQLGAVEEVVSFGDRYAGVVIARIVSCEKHPNADRLKVCLIDDNSRVEGVERTNEGLVQVVCGAPNAREGLMVAWLPPGSTVPDSFDKEPFVLEARELRGVMSNGMLASPKELAINDSHEGILEIADAVSPGAYFVDAFELRNESVIDIENKMFTHRPDCFGWLGVAREIAGISDQSYQSPKWYREGSAGIYDRKSETHLPLVVQNTLPDLVPRFVAITMSDVSVAPSPVWLQMRLVRHGIRPINNIVDITNYVMLETGQPLHAYDYDKVKAQDGAVDTATIGVRVPTSEETLRLLNGKTIQPRNEAIVIASATKAIGLGGVMGGGETEVDENTKNIILECATFDMYSIRRTAMAHGVFTDAVTRFNKGQSPYQNKQIAERTVQMLQDLAGAKFVEVFDDDHTPHELPEVSVTATFINDRLGVELQAKEMQRLLENVEFQVNVHGEELRIQVPFWRTDISIAEDIVEEIGRLYGYDRLPRVLPTRVAAPTQKDTLLSLKQTIRTVLASGGGTEVLTYSFVHGDLLMQAEQNVRNAFRLSNALSPDLQYYRLSLLPSLLDKIHMNVKAGHNEFALFELGKAHAVSAVEDGLPKEWNNIALVYAADEKTASTKQGAAFYEARQYVDLLLKKLGIAYRLVAPGEITAHQHKLMASVFNPDRMAAVVNGDCLIGFVGEYKAGLRKSLKLPTYAAGFELSLDTIAELYSTHSEYVPLSRYPNVEQDMTLVTPDAVSYAELEAFLTDTLQEEARSHDATCHLMPLDIYRADGASTRNITFRMTFVNHARTMTDSEINSILDRSAVRAHELLKVERI